MRQCNIPLPLQNKKEFKYNYNIELPFSFICENVIKIPIITNHHSGNYVSSLANSVVDLNKFNVLEHKYKSGAGPYNHTDWGDSQTFTLKEAGIFDLYVSHYSLSGDRMNFYLYFYDNNDDLLGSLEYHKDSNTWSTGNYTTIRFRDSIGDEIINLPASNYSGTTYGNGYFHQTIDLRDPSKLKTYPKTYSSNTHQTHINHTYIVNHGLENTKKVKIYIDYTYATYFSSTNGSNINLYLASGFDYFGPLTER